MDNRTLAQRLRQHACELDVEGGNLYRVRAYRRAADVIEEMDAPVAALLEHNGRRALEALPAVGSHIALTIESLLHPEAHIATPAA